MDPVDQPDPSEKRAPSDRRPAPAHRAASSAGSSAPTVLCTAASLGLFLVLVRAHLLGYVLSDLATFFRQAPEMLAAAVYDLAYAAALTAAFLLPLAALRRWPKTRRLVCALFALAAALSLIAAVGNITAVRMLGKPFNYQWLYYSGFLQNLDTRQTLNAHLTVRTVSGLALTCAAMLGVAGFLRLGLPLLPRAARLVPAPVRRHFPRQAMAGAAVGTALCAVVAYFPLALWFLNHERWPYDRTANPVTAFAASYLDARRGGGPLFTMETPVGPEDFLPAGDSRAANRAATRPGGPPAGRGDPAVRNVVVFVLESTPAAYLEPYGGRHPVNPELKRYLDRAALFDNVYAHAPATNNSLVSILCSIYPMISYQAITVERPAIDVPSLSGELKRRGYDTGFFYCSDVSFQGGDRFLARRGFDLVEDYKTRQCPGEPFRSERWHALNGSDDVCTADSLLRWVDGRRDASGGDARTPFFAMLWTGMTHYPYFHAGEQTDFGVGNESHNRYLNAMRRGDAALGNLLRGLESRGLLDSTLVVVVGDHGEAFGQHGKLGHASAIYEENVRVPLILINRRLFHGERHAAVGGLIDIGPTVTELLGLATPGRWQGRSLFAAGRSGRAYFFAPWSDQLFGYRDGNRKVIFNATHNTYEVYDLAADPHETRNLAESLPGAATEARQHLAAWVQFQHRFIGGLPDFPPAAAARHAPASADVR